MSNAGKSETTCIGPKRSGTLSCLQSHCEVSKDGKASEQCIHLFMLPLLVTDVHSNINTFALGHQVLFSNTFMLCIYMYFENNLK